LEETLRTLNDLVRQGKVRYIGLSNLMSWQAATGGDASGASRP
jgi:aryl-alcohol dehydrogenase-like predicted oxidoreductase